MIIRLDVCSLVVAGSCQYVSNLIVFERLSGGLLVGSFDVRRMQDI